MMAREIGKAAGKVPARATSLLLAGAMAFAIGMSGTVLAGGAQAEAATFKTPAGDSGTVTVSGKTFRQTGSQISVTHKGSSRVLVRSARHGFATDGTSVYYVRPGSKASPAPAGGFVYRGAVYRCSVKSGKSQKVSRGGFDTVKGAVGKYVYAGVDQGEDGIRLYAVNAKTKRAKFMAAGVGGVQCAGKRVMTTPSYGVLGNYPICTFKKDGSGKRKIGTGFAGKLTKKHAYYVQYSYAKSKYRAFRCNPDGTKKKAVTKWVASRSEVAKYQR